MNKNGDGRPDIVARLCMVVDWCINNQRTEDYKNGKYKLAGGVVDPIPDDAHVTIVKLSLFTNCMIQ